MSGPRRLRDDPELRETLGVRMEDEARLLAPADLGALKAKTLAAAAADGAVAAPALGSLTLLKTVVGVAVLGAGAAYMLQPPAPAALAPPPVRSTTPPPVVEVAPPPAAPPRAVVDPPPPAAAPDRTTSLRAQLEAYEVGDAHLRAGRFDAAARALRAYLTRFPAGGLRAEAEIGLLEALYRGERHADVVALAERLLAQPDARSHEVRRLHVESLALLGRCADAKEALAAAPADVRSAARAAVEGCQTDR